MATIARIDSYALAYPEPHHSDRARHVTLARVEADDGTFGWGEAISQWPEAALATKTVIDQGLARLLLGADLANVRSLWTLMREHAYWHGEGGIVSFAISALDTALWDLAGKVADRPVHELLGGALHERVRTCASVILDTLDLDRTAEEFREYRARGYTAVKGGWGQVNEAGFGTDEHRDLEIARTLRDAVGEDVGLSLDVSALAHWTRAHACRMARKLEQFELAWLEDALPHRDEDGWKRLRSSTTLALATGERCWTLDDYRRLVVGGSVDIILIDPGRVDGLSGTFAAAQLAAMHGVHWVPHSWSSAINTAAALHAFAATPNGVVFELKPNRSPMQHELVAKPFEQAGGWLEVPSEPGLGVAVDEEVVRHYGFGP
jgi:L-alanine-DL-glutamate epimerase-like enolase superfamily enzyme